MDKDNTDTTKNNIASNIAKPVYLQDCSPTGKKRPWRERKMGSRAIAASMYRIWNKHPRRDAEFKKRADRLYYCSDYLAFGEHLDPETGEVVKLLDAANFCRDRMCPMCQWRKSLVMFHQVSDIMNRIDVTHPGEYVPIFLTLTMRNVPANRLGWAISHILKSWTRMMNSKQNRKPWRVCAGWFRALEITYNAETGEWHPHIHAVVIVPVTYFDKSRNDYISQEDWIAEWRWAMQADYDPSVDVRTIKNSRADAVAEVTKYAVKPGEWLRADPEETDANVRLLATELKNRRLTAFGGLMLEVRKQLKQEDAEKADLVKTGGEDDEMRDDMRIALERYEWQAGITNDYVLVSREEFDPSAAASE